MAVQTLEKKRKKKKKSVRDSGHRWWMERPRGRRVKGFIQKRRKEKKRKEKRKKIKGKKK